MENLMNVLGIDCEDLNEDVNYFASEKTQEVVEETEEKNSEEVIENMEEKIVEETSEEVVGETKEESLLSKGLGGALIDAFGNNEEEPISETVKLLKAELGKDYETKIPAKPIIEFLIKKCDEEDEFSKRVSLEGKTVERCLKYISTKLRENKKGVVEDQVLFDLAVDYYLLKERVLESESAKLLQDKMYDEFDRNLPAIPIIEYLINKCEKDKEFADRVGLEEKTFEDCGKYVLQEVKKLLEGMNGYVEDQDVYDMAVDYYILDGKLIEKPKVTPRPTPKTKTSSSKTSASKVEPVEEKPKPQMSLFEF